MAEAEKETMLVEVGQQKAESRPKVQRGEDSRKERHNEATDESPKCCKKGEFEATMYTAVGFVMIGLIFPLIGFTIVFFHSNKAVVERFQEGSCTVLKFNDTGIAVSCKCDAKYCLSTHPCVFIHATLAYTDETTQERELTTQLYDHMHGVTYAMECSANPCDPDDIINIQAVRNFTKSWETIGKEDVCYYDTADPYRATVKKPVVINRRWAYYPVVVGIGSALAVCMLIVIITCAMFGCKNCIVYMEDNSECCCFV